MFKQMNIRKGCLLKSLIFWGLWLLLFLLPLIQGLFAFEESAGFPWRSVFRFWNSLILFFIAFLLHDLVLLPVYTRKGREWVYVILTLVLISLFTVVQYRIHRQRESIYYRPNVEHAAPPVHSDAPPPHHHVSPKPPKGRLPMPVVADTCLLVLLLGFNLAVVLIFRYKKMEEERKQLENMRMQDELRYLKAQIDPHFFMNMLNNIHSMVDVNPELAQQMILDLSKLMRYVLYEGSNSYTTFENEVQFISKYVELMRQRYPSDKVEVSLDVPETPSASLLLPPLLFISFVENAFKHGVSYMRKSEISVSLSEEPSRICFRCSNTRPPLETRADTKGGVGLANVRRRLDLLYQDRYKLDIVETDEIYSVILIIPGL